MLETIRAYALERLKESDELDEAERRHAHHFFQFARGLEQTSPTVAG
jgi:predicted ATPase